jgi:hypothetical protein
VVDFVLGENWVGGIDVIVVWEYVWADDRCEVDVDNEIVGSDNQF